MSTIPEARHIIIVNTDCSLAIATQAMPTPAPDEVLVQVIGAGINRPDLLQRQGRYPPPSGASPILGLEISGRVVQCGSAVSRWQAGDLVCGLCNGGGYADYTVLPADQCLPIPTGMSPLEAAGLPEVMFTVWHNVFQRGHLQAGETFLVHGGSSGIGTAAISLAHAFGATVYATAGSDEKCSACSALGAHRAVNYRQEDFVEVLKDATGGKGINLILDMVGGDYLQKNLKLASVEGRIVNIAYQRGSCAEVDFLPLLLKRLTLTASTLRAQSASQKAQIARELEREVWPRLASGEIRLPLDRIFDFAQVEQAHAHMEAGQHIGKILLKVSE